MRLSGFVRVKVISATVLGALVLCQVLGALCAMPSPMFSAEETVVLMPHTHLMPMEDNPCQESLISSASSFKKALVQVAVLSDLAATIGFNVGLHRSDLVWSDHPLKHPPHTSLSVLRI